LPPATGDDPVEQGFSNGFAVDDAPKALEPIVAAASDPEFLRLAKNTAARRPMRIVQVETLDVGLIDDVGDRVLQWVLERQGAGKGRALSERAAEDVVESRSLPASAIGLP